ncbi:phasin family protein [Aquabacter cavernae]|uniref:phasin family protein n=1 Tax=Aquabacter cavernae TaxID=2496029 RepID=UPI000F8C9EB8|nr:phasin family protein [Aquabacter cavernae]
MSSKFGPDLELPAELRVIAEKNVAQARQAFDTLFDSARSAVGDSEERIKEVQSGIKELRAKTIGLVEANVNASFDFLNKLVQARSPQEVLSLQAAFVTEQVQAVAAQAATFGADARTLGESTIRSLDEHARALADRLQTLTTAATAHAKSVAEDLQTAGAATAKTAQSAFEQATKPNDPNQTY